MPSSIFALYCSSFNIHLHILHQHDIQSSIFALCSSSFKIHILHQHDIPSSIFALYSSSFKIHLHILHQYDIPRSIFSQYSSSFKIHLHILHQYDIPSSMFSLCRIIIETPVGVTYWFASDRCHHSSAAVTPVIYECDLTEIKDILQNHKWMQQESSVVYHVHILQLSSSDAYQI